MSGPTEWTVAELQRHLMGAVELELTTIPPYLTALYSIKKDTNKEAAEVIESVVFEEMLHLLLAANVLNAIGGAPDIVGEYTPRYPTALPFHEPKTFEVGIGPFSDEALDVFLAIENPSVPGVEPPPASPAAARPRVLELAEEFDYKTIGDFYGAIEDGLKTLDERPGVDLFVGKASKQIGPDHFRDGHVVIVENLKTALEALEEIVEQGEGEVTKPPPGDKFDPEGQLAHFYRFQELRLRRKYEKEDLPGKPSGPAIEIDFGAVYPMRKNLTMAELAGDQLTEAEAFSRLYSGLLREVQQGIDGEPEALTAAIGTMFQLPKPIIALLQKALPGGGGEHAGPIFEYRPQA